MAESRKKILVVDDEEEMTRLLKIELEQEEYEIFVAHNGEEGLKKVREVQPDIIVLDVMMPGMDGYEMLSILKIDDAIKETPVILLSAKTQEADIQKGKELGAQVYITKPFSSDDLIAAIDKVLERA